MKKFEDFVKKHSLLPDNDMYNALGLSGEAGEVANVIKKIEIRKNLDPLHVVSMNSMEDYKDNLKEELGDVLFYLTILSLNNGLNLNDLMEMQMDKMNKQFIKYNRDILK